MERRASENAGPAPKSPYTGALLHGLRELGYVYGEHFVTEPRLAEGELDRLFALAAVIVGGGPVLVSLKGATSTIPVVMLGAADPVGQGFAQSLGRPGGNFTGLSIQMVESSAKRLELLKELVPGTAPVGVLWDPRASTSRPSWQAAEAAARARRWPLLSLEVRDAGEIEEAFKAATGALLVLPTVLPDRQASRIVELAAKSRLASRHVRIPPLRGLRRVGLLFSGYHRDLPARSRLRRQDPQGRQTRRSARGAANELRAGHQPEDRQGTRPHGPALSPPAC